MIKRTHLVNNIVLRSQHLDESRNQLMQSITKAKLRFNALPSAWVATGGFVAGM